MEALAVVGLGQLGRLFGAGALGAGAVVHPIRRGDDVGARLGRVPAGAPILIATGETALSSVVAALPVERRADVVLVQNELFPSVWHAAGLASPTLAVVWLSQKSGRPTEVARRSEIYGRHAGALAEVFGALGLPFAVVHDAGEMATALAAKHAFILVINALGLAHAGTVGEILDERTRLSRALPAALRLADALHREGRSLDARFAHADVDLALAEASVLEAMEGLRHYPAKGRTASERVERAKADAARLGVDVRDLLAA